MFEALTDKLQDAFRRFGARGVVTEDDLDQALRDVRLAMLEADVNFRVVREFTSRVRERALGADVLRSLTPAQQVLDIVNRELTEVVGATGGGRGASGRYGRLTRSRRNRSANSGRRAHNRARFPTRAR